MPQLTLQALDGAYAISRLDATASIPAWADGEGFVSISRTDDELSVVCLADRVPGDVKSDDGWTCFKLVGPFAFDETGIALAVIKPLAEAGIGIFLVSTFDTDYLLVKSVDAANARQLLADAGHVFVR
jgi:uncharacterized protein